jgi:hypothetical protein
VHEGEIPTLVLAPFGSCLLARFEKSFIRSQFTYEKASATLTGFEPVNAYFFVTICCFAISSLTAAYECGILFVKI